ncbi:MAG TPA: SIS domain-containing protein [Blastocatellia bacterium]|nr:SIS domain-containing protein [Blastocatellia bacterium]HMV87422.1 SIS domain-containing protein [Blastocatellia bacterium]HMX25350.1 SIS domain-containing protein [Blastocatellia bacterium]HMZ16657.1 SIS domain-containing protein [Blastocatellia bacterium]HNG32096.1 SIS domain-containing protein [Blastocatellia bacterium]
MSLMLSEIEQQPAAIERTIQREAKKIESFSARLKANRPRLIVLVARGSSDNAALFGRYLLELTTGIPVSLAAPAVHTLYKKKLDLRDALVVGVSQSGEGVDINLTLENAKRSGATTLAITNEAESSMAQLSDETFLIHAGRERSVAATKTFTGQLLIFHLLARALSDAPKQMEVERLPELAAESLKLKSDVAEMVERYAFMKQCVVVGRGLNYANAYEFAIKLMETCYVVAERFSGADFLHGPIAMVDSGFPVFLFAPPGPTLNGTKDLLAKLKIIGAETVVISSESAALKAASRGIKIQQRIPELLSPIPYIIPAQLFAALLAEAKGLTPDQPRSLSKVTKTV